jgi:hypothetical protein
MVRRTLIPALLALVALMMLSASVVAGGWGTVVLHEGPEDVSAGVVERIEFEIMQHGVTPTDWTTTWVQITNGETGATERVAATYDRSIGRWVAEIIFPSAGTWTWAVQTDELFIETTFDAVTVAQGAATGVTQAELNSAITQATEGLHKQVSSMALEIDALQKQVGSLAAERDMLQKQLTELGSTPPPAAESGTPWWLAGIVGAATALVVTGIAFALATRRGLVVRRDPEPVPE